MKATLMTAWGYQGDNMKLPVADVEAATPFYESVLGFKAVSRSDSPHKSVVLGRDAVQMRLIENGGDPSQDGCAFQVNDVTALLEEFKSHGLQKELSDLGTEEREDGSSWKVFFVVAPDGLCYWFGEKVPGL